MPVVCGDFVGVEALDFDGVRNGATGFAGVGLGVLILFLLRALYRPNIELEAEKAVCMLSSVEEVEVRMLRSVEEVESEKAVCLLSSVEEVEAMWFHFVIFLGTKSMLSVDFLFCDVNLYFGVPISMDLVTSSTRFFSN